jgi:hypothetical protein
VSADSQDAARLLAFGLRPKQRPARNLDYADLVRRYRGDSAFADHVTSIAIGLDLAILDVDMSHGIVVAATEDSTFALKVTEYARRTGGEGKASDRVLHGLAHLGAATMAYPRPADLGSPAYVGRITVHGVDAFVREAARLLKEKAAAEDTDADPPTDHPDLEAAWRAYERRAQNPGSADRRRVSSSTFGMVSKALAFLAEQGMLVRAGDEGGGTYRTTTRYRVQVLDAGARMFDELLALGVTEVSDGRGTLSVVPITWTPDDVAEL